MPNQQPLAKTANDVPVRENDPTSLSEATTQLLPEAILASGHESMVSMLETIFELLQMCAYEINQTTKGSDLELAWVRPAFGKEMWQFGSHNFHSPVVSGRLSTRKFSLILRGTPLDIGFYVLSGEHLVRFNSDASTFQPYGKLVAGPISSGVGWFFDEILLEREHVTLIAKHLMEILMQCARNEVVDPDGFAAALRNLQSLDEQERDRQKGFREQFFSVLKKSLPTANQLPEGSPLREEVAALTPILVAGVREATALALAVPHDLISNVPINPPSNLPSNPINQIEPTLVDVDLAAIDRVCREGQPSTKTDAAGAPDVVANTVSSTEPRLGATGISMLGLPAALQILLQSLDLELEAVSQAGAQAFNARDLARTQAILELTNKLSELRQLAEQLYNDYQGGS
jgi:hypothetical protein